jgi:hypothetical protein
MRKTPAFGIALSCLVSGCGTAQQVPAPKLMTTEEELAIASRVTDCEWKAVGRYDDGHNTVAGLAQQIIGVCTSERIRMRIAFKIPLNDPQYDLEDFKQAVGIVEYLRKSRGGRE